MSAAAGMKLGCQAPAQPGCRGSAVKAFRLAAPDPPSRQHHAFQAAAAAAAVAATGTDQVFSQDPALDSLIDRWLSHKHASTSAAADAQLSSNGSNRSSRGQPRQQQQQQQSLQQEWEALLGPVTVTLTSLATLEEGDEVFALSDSLGHLGSSLQELQQMASALLLQQQQQQQQQQDSTAPAPAAAAGVAHYTQQLAELLAAATEQAAALADTGLLHLLGISTVLLTTIRHTSSSSSSSMEPAVQAAAVAAVQAACAELWQRPAVAGGLDAGQLTSLCVILRRLSKLGVSRSTLPVSLPLSAYAQLRGLSEAQLSGLQLAVCCWCLSSLAVPPPADAVTAALRTAAMTARSSSSSSSGSGLDDLALRRLLAACLNWHPYLAGQLSSAAGVNLAAAAAEWVESAAQAAVELSSANSSSSSSEAAWKVVASVAQAGAAYGVYPGDDFGQAVAGKLLQEQQAPAPAAAAAALSSREFLEAAAAAGCLVPWWGRFAAGEQQLQLCQAVLQPADQQQQQQQVQQPQLLQQFLAGVEHVCRSAAGSLSSDCLQQVHTQLGAIAEHLIASSSSSTCTSQLLRAMMSSNCRSQQLPQLCALVAQQGTAPAADAAAVLCALKPSGWQQQLQQQLLPTLAGPDGRDLQQLPLAAAMALHAATAGAVSASSAAGDVAAAVLRRLLEPGVLRGASGQEAAELLVVLTVGQAPWRVVAEQQLQASPPAGFLQLGSSNADVAVLVQHQCLCCMGVIVQDGGRSLLPGQVVPVLVALCYLKQAQQQGHPQQQPEQQQQWLGPMAGQLLPAYKQLHREALAAVSLQLQDCAGLLAPSDLAWPVRLLALLQSRPSLTLAAAVRAAAGVVGHMQQQDLVWMLWGLTKLQFPGERRLQQQLLSAALRRAAAVPAGSEADGLDEQDWADAAATIDDSTASSTASSSTAELDSDVALLWVAASRGSREPVVQQLLSVVTQHADDLRPAQVAAVLWSFTRMAAQGLMQQQRPEVLQLVEHSLSSSRAAADDLSPRHIAVLAWGLHKLGHQPSNAASARLTAAALQHIQQQQQQQQQSSSSPAAFLPGEFSCLLYCLAEWGVQLPQQQLQQLEVYLQQQLNALQAAGASADAASANGSSGGSFAHSAQWDGPAVCSACWGLSQLGATLQPSTLQAAEQYLLRLIPASTPAAKLAATTAQRGDSTAPSSGSRSYQQRRQRQQRVPPAASDLVLFGTACRAAGYQPLQLLQQLRGWLLMQLAQRGPNGLLALQSRAPAGRSTANLAAATTAAEAGRMPRPSRRAGRQQQQQHAHILSGVLLFLRQTAYAEPALLQQLEAVSMEPLVFEQLQWREANSSRQLVMILSSFCQLGYVPQVWLGRAGVRCIMRHVLGSFQQPGTGGTSTASSGAGSGGSNSSKGGSLSAQDCVQLMQCLAAWQKQPSLLSNTAVQQYILPGLAQTLLGVRHQPKPTQAAAGPAAAPAVTKQSTAEPAVSSTSISSNGTAGSGAEGPTAGSSAGANLVAHMSGWQVVTLLRCMSQLDLPQSRKLFQRLQQQLLRRVQQVWPDLGPAGQVAAAHAAGSSGMDFSALLKVPELLPQPQQDAQCWHFSEASAASRLLWVFGNVARHPGQQLLAAALSRVADAASAAAEVGMPLPLREVSTALYAVAVLQELQHPLAVALVQLLQQVAEEGELLGHPQFDQQAEQLAACLLAAQDAAQAGGTPPPAPIASFDAEQGSAAVAAAQQSAGADTAQQGPDRAAAGRAAAVARSSPWLALPTAVQQRLLEAWRRKVLRKAGKRQGMGEHMQLVMSLRQLGLRGRAKAPTDDGYVCIDVAITAPSGERIAVELLGPHNAAVNTQKPLAPARLKWRMLAARGYKVVVVNMWQWRTLDSGGWGRLSRDEGGISIGNSSSGSSSSVSDGAESSLEEYDGSVMSEKLLYLQARLQAALGPAGVAALSAATRRTRPLPEMLGDGRGVQQQQSAGTQPASRRTNLFGANLAPGQQHESGGQPAE